MSSNKRKPPVHFFSFRSPYSWIADRMLRDALSAAELAAIEFVPYWEPDAATLALLRERGGEFLYRPMSREKHLYILQDVKRITRSLQLSHVWPIDRDPSWEQPVRAYLVARRLGRGAEFREALYRARWESGSDIHCPRVLAELADPLGIGDLAAQMASSVTIEEAVQILLRAGNAGVFGVPFFQIGLEKFWGVDRVPAFISTLRGDPLPFAWTRALSPSARRDSKPGRQVDPSQEFTHASAEEPIATNLLLDADAAGGCG
jgi:2-hydroxychromene-2-carboxylate isomerase